jgi:hypothetical protein
MAKEPMRNGQSQKQRFIDAAREAGASEDPLEFERALRGVAKAPPPASVQRRKIVHDSDCAVNNGPAYKAGPCDCGAEERAKAER